MGVYYFEDQNMDTLERSYWADWFTEQKKTCCQDAQEELQEFQEGSRELEAELEAQLTQAEHHNSFLYSPSKTQVSFLRLKTNLFSGCSP
uniref:Uncharacterized protein n=1 Tax=Cynoglossus semilaevis TaxID=244447 RepID=A0A3P8W4G7_CYNSE